MLRKGTFVLALLLATPLSGICYSNDGPPSDESIAQLIQLSHAESNFDALKPQIEALMRKSLDEAAGGRQLSAAQRAAYDRGRERMVAVMSARYTWDSMREIYLRVYQSTFTQDELDGIIAFYRTPAGAAWLSKMPVLQQHLLDETQAWMRPVLKEFQTISEQMRADMERANADAG